MYPVRIIATFVVSSPPPLAVYQDRPTGRDRRRIRPAKRWKERRCTQGASIFLHFIIQFPPDPSFIYFLTAPLPLCAIFCYAIHQPSVIEGVFPHYFCSGLFKDLDTENRGLVRVRTNHRVTFGVSSQGCLPQFQNPKLRPEIVERRHSKSEGHRSKSNSNTCPSGGSGRASQSESMGHFSTTIRCFLWIVIPLFLSYPSHYGLPLNIDAHGSFCSQNFFYCRNLCHYTSKLDT